MTIPPNIWQDNFLTGSTPFAVNPRLLAAQGAPIHYGFQITPAELPAPIHLAGEDIFANGENQDGPANTVMDVDRYEQDMAALAPGRQISHSISAPSIASSAMRLSADLDPWPGAQFRQVDGRCRLHRHCRSQAARVSFPNAYPGAAPAFAPLYPIQQRRRCHRRFRH